jgi:hypothetical protein
MMEELFLFLQLSTLSFNLVPTLLFKESHSFANNLLPPAEFVFDKILPVATRYLRSFKGVHKALPQPSRF